MDSIWVKLLESLKGGNRMAGTTIELMYVISFALISLFGILAYTEKMSVGIALISIGIGIVIAWYFSPYMSIAITPIANWIMYGYDITWHTIVAVGHIVSLLGMVLVAGYNLFASGGKIIWA